MLVGGIAETKLGPRVVTLSGGLLMSLGVFMSHISIRFNFWLLLVTYGLMYGIGVGVAYIGPVSCAIRWLPNWKGVASGIVVSGFGISSFIFTLIQTAYINPNNIPPDESLQDGSNEKYFTDSELLNRVPYVFLILGGIFTSLQILASVFIVNPLPPGLQADESRPVVSGNATPPTYSPSTSLAESQLIRKYTDTSISPCDMLKKPSFYLLWIMFFSVSTGNVLVTSLYKSFGLEEVINDDHYLSIAGGVSSFFNLLGRLLWGVLADVTSHKVAIVMQGGLATALLFTFYATGTHQAMFFVWICGLYFCFGGYYSLYPSLTARLYGTEYISINYGLLYTSQIIASLSVSFLSQILRDMIDWYGLFFIVSTLSLVEFVLALCYNNKKYVFKK